MTIPAMKIEELIDAGREHDCEGVGGSNVCVVVAAVADLPSRFGDFQVAGFWNNRDEEDHAAFIHGNPCGAENVLVRLHSECVTGDVAGSLRCDCRDQLEASLVKIAEAEVGIVLYLRQEGRGIGFTNKVRAYALQDKGLDTVEANLALGFADDLREYAVAAHMLHSLGVKSIRLMTNNPSKVEQLTEYGVTVSERVPHLLPPNRHNVDYLRTKARKSGHFIDPAITERLLEQDDEPIME
ncbi:MAG: GTP cyclohydrolase II [Actinomycetota bacterium]